MLFKNLVIYSTLEGVTGFSITFIGNWTVIQIMPGDLG